MRFFLAKSPFLWLDERMNIFTREVGSRRYRIASQSLWDPVRQRPFARQAVLGPADAAPMVDLGSVRTIGTQRIGDVGALLWVAEQLDLIRLIDRTCGLPPTAQSPTLGEMVLAVAVQRACDPGAKCHVAAFLQSCLPRVSCLPATAFSGQTFHRLAAQVQVEQLEKAQLAIAQAILQHYVLATDVLAFDTTNFDTHIATTTAGELAQRGHAKSHRSDLRVVGLAILVSETGHVPLLHRPYPGNSSDQTVLSDCLKALGELHTVLQEAQPETPPGCRTIVRDGGSWREQLELDLKVEGYHTLISLPLSHSAAQWALEQAARRGAMKRVGGRLEQVRAARCRRQVGELDRTLVVVESQELLRGQKRGMAVALGQARVQLRKLERRAGGLSRTQLEERVKKILGREHLSDFVVTTIQEKAGKLSLTWKVDAAQRRRLERTRLGRRVLCTDHHLWSNGRIIESFRGQWKVEELFRRSKKGGVVPWGPSHQWADSSLRLPTFATVLGLALVSLVGLQLESRKSAKATMEGLAEIRATLVRVRTQQRGRRATVLLAPDLSREQEKAIATFALDKWLPILSSSKQDTENADIKLTA